VTSLRAEVERSRAVELCKVCICTGADQEGDTLTVRGRCFLDLQRRYV
jgi:hypothetical protein